MCVRLGDTTFGLLGEALSVFAVRSHLEGISLLYKLTALKNISYKSTPNNSVGLGKSIFEKFLMFLTENCFFFNFLFTVKVMDIKYICCYK